MSTQLILKKLEEHDRKFDLIFDKLNKHDSLFDKFFQKLDALDQKFELLFGKFEEVDVRFDAISQTLDIVQEQTERIPRMEASIQNLQNDVDLVKKVLTDSNKQVRRHEHFINSIKAAATAAAT